MKKLATIFMLAVVILIGGATADSKTTKKKSKARTTQSSSNAMWNGDLPTGKNLCNRSNFPDEYYKKGYVDENWAVEKNGVCSIEPLHDGSGITITVYNPSKLNWLYQDLQKANAKYKTFRKIESSYGQIIATYR